MPIQTPQPTRKRLAHLLDTPFSTVPWYGAPTILLIHLCNRFCRPEISSDDQDNILELLCKYAALATLRLPRPIELWLTDHL